MNRILFAVALFVAGCGNTAATPTAPSNLTVEPLSGGAHVTWQDNADNETDFMIERKAAGGDFTTLASVTFDTTAYHDSSVAAGSMYVYRVMAMNAAGMSAPSNEVSFTATGTPMSMDMGAASDMSTGSATCHQAGCRVFASKCSTTGCTCIAVIKDNPDPTCTGSTMTCSPDPCAGKTAVCDHPTGQCKLQ